MNRLGNLIYSAVPFALITWGVYGIHQPTALIVLGSCLWLDMIFHDMKENKT